MKIFSCKYLADKRGILKDLKEGVKVSDEYLEKVKNDIEKGKIHEEDYLLLSSKYPIFTVADGVALIKFIVDEEEYPDPSPVYEVSKIFCETALKLAEQKYLSFSLEDIKECFKEANRKIEEYNKTCGLTKETVDYWEKDFYSCTAGLLVIKEKNAFWGTIGDVFLIHYSPSDNHKFISPPLKFYYQESRYSVKDFKSLKEKKIYGRKYIRNALDENGNPVGYGVLTGEENALAYIHSGGLSLKENDLLFLLTDGFFDYFDDKSFIELFIKCPDSLKEELEKLMEKKIDEDPVKFGMERSLVAIKI